MNFPSNVKSANVCVSHIESVEKFSVILAKNLIVFGRLQNYVNELEIQPVQIYKDHDIVEGSLVLVKYKEDGQKFRAEVVQMLEEDMIEAKLIDVGRVEKVAQDHVFPLPQQFRDLPPLSITNCKLFQCHSTKEETLVAFKKFSQGILNMQVMKSQAGCLEVDLVIPGPDNVTSIRDLLIFTAGAVFNNDPYLPITNINSFDIETKDFLMTGDKRECFLSHVPRLKPGEEVMLYLQIVSKETLKLPRLCSKMAAVYNTVNSNVMHDLVGSGCFSVGMVCAVGDGLGGWFRGVITKTGSDRMVWVKYIDFGNEEYVNAHKLRYLQKKFRKLPALAVPVFLPAVPNLRTQEDAELVYRELIISSNNLIFNEFKLEVLKISNKGKTYVSLDTLDGVNLKEFVVRFVKLLNEEKS